MPWMNVSFQYETHVPRNPCAEAKILGMDTREVIQASREYLRTQFFGCLQYLKNLGVLEGLQEINRGAFWIIFDGSEEQLKSLHACLQRHNLGMMSKAQETDDNEYDWLT